MGMRSNCTLLTPENRISTDPPSRHIYLRLPKELGLPSSTLGFLIRCCYGTRDAGSIWEAFYVDSLCSMGFKQGKSSPCVFWHPD